MSAFRHIRLQSIGRVLVLTLIALGLVLQPALASLGEMHELMDHASSSHTHFQHSGFTDKAIETADGDTGRGDALHLLVHFAHCCGLSMVFCVPCLDVPSVIPSKAALLPREPQQISSTHPYGPFRPPIPA